MGGIIRKATSCFNCKYCKLFYLRADDSLAHRCTLRWQVIDSAWDILCRPCYCPSDEMVSEEIKENEKKRKGKQQEE